MQKITPCLWFNGNGEEAIQFYTSVFKDSRITSSSRYGSEGPGPEGELLVGTFLLNGQEFMVLNARAPFTFSEAISFMVSCDTQEEVDYYWSRLTENGGQESQCGWLKDKYGLSWQIVPKLLGTLMQDKDKARAGRVMQAMMKMKKIESTELQAAYDGE